MKNLIRKWIDEGNIRRSRDAVHKLCSILMVMRLHDIARTEKDVQQRHIIQRVQLLGGEDIDEVLMILLEQQVIVYVIKELYRRRSVIDIQCHVAFALFYMEFDYEICLCA